jgi:2-succinyl-5-enolpyruvyl-6-hydroxy-3-cyclohexene-1-carboxylate synthase
LSNAGITRFVVSPGSRSTPLVDALQRAAGVATTVIIDERSAGFYALGQAKITGEPTALVCTSGSALGHYLPALIEADESRTPLLVLSANRPGELQGNRSPQTIDQTQFFGGRVRLYYGLGEPRGDWDALSGLQRKVIQAVGRARGPVPGPVHLDFPAGKPLEPTAATTVEELAIEQRVSELLGAPPQHHAPALAAPAPSAVDELLRLARAAQCPVCVFGPMSPCHVGSTRALRRELAARRWPVLAEATCQQRFSDDVGLTQVDAFDLLYRTSFAPRLTPDFVLQIGDPPTSGAWARLLQARASTAGSTAAPTRCVVTQTEWPDPQNSARLIVSCDLEPLGAALEGRLPEASQAWVDQIGMANQIARRCVRAELDSEATPSHAIAAVFDEAAAFDILDHHLARGDLLALGNSLPVRIADAVLGARPRAIACLSQRGANGIDGLISLATGASSVHAGRTVLVLGDVSTLHDLGGLVALSRAMSNITVLVLNNRGGRIFEQLPIVATPNPAVGNAKATGRLDVVDSDAWLTPHEFELWRVAAALGVPAMAAQSRSELELALQHSLGQPGPCFVEAMLSPSAARQRSARWISLVEAALASEQP